MAAGVDNTLGYTATHYFSSEASSRVVTDRPGEVVVVNVKIAWAESGAQSLMEGTHISGDWARACAARRKPCLFFLCAQNAEAACGLDSNPRETSYDAALDKRRLRSSLPKPNFTDHQWSENHMVRVVIEHHDKVRDG